MKGREGQRKEERKEGRKISKGGLQSFPLLSVHILNYSPRLEERKRKKGWKGGRTAVRKKERKEVGKVQRNKGRKKEENKEGRLEQ